MILKMGEKSVDMAKSWPWNIRDMKAFKAAGITDDKGDINTNDLESLEKMLRHLCRKVDETVTDEQVELIDIVQLQAFGVWLANLTEDAGFVADGPT